MFTELMEVRTGRLGLIGASGIRSGIAKVPRHDAVVVQELGLDGDQQAESFHGGREKAILHYDAGHYAAWAAEFPQIADRFVPGGFGENIVAHGFSEATLCIGDRVRAGTALLQVSEPRQPCFKLNHRFGDGGIARRAQESGRTGWLYRVLEPGLLRAGDRMEVVDRPLPEWPIARLQRFLYHLTDDLERAAELAALPYLSEGFRTLFARRVTEGRTEDWGARLSNGPVKRRESGWFEAELREVEHLTPDVRAYTLGRADGRPLPLAETGAHVDVMVENAWARSYSLIPAPAGMWRIAVRRNDDGRGGSAAIHRGWREGLRLTVSQQRTHFPLVQRAVQHHFLAAGIGITPFLGMIEARAAQGADWHLTWLVRDATNLPFPDLPRRHAGRVRVHVSGGRAEARFAPGRDLPCHAAGLHLYCCGPAGLMQAVREATADWLPGHVHFESFAAASAPSDQPFTVSVEGHDAVIRVGGTETLLAALRRSGFAVGSDCEVGNCGACIVPLRSGEVDHRDVHLGREARAHGMASCVSRGRGHLKLGPLAGAEA